MNGVEGKTKTAGALTADGSNQHAYKMHTYMQCETCCVTPTMPTNLNTPPEQGGHLTLCEAVWLPPARPA